MIIWMIVSMSGSGTPGPQQCRSAGVGETGQQIGGRIKQRRQYRQSGRIGAEPVQPRQPIGHVGQRGTAAPGDLV